MIIQALATQKDGQWFALVSLMMSIKTPENGFSNFV